MASEVSPFGDAAPIVDADHAVVGFAGLARMMAYDYSPVDARDGGALFPDEPRMVVESVGSDDAGWTEVSRRYEARFISEEGRVEVSERAASAGAAYGAAGNPRTTSAYLWRSRGAGRIVRRATPDGLVTTWSHEFTSTNAVVRRMTSPSSSPGGIPFRTVEERSFENARGDVVREETWLVVEDGGASSSRGRSTGVMRRGMS